MLDKTIAFLYNFDIIGPNPKLYIFNKERYQSVFSLVISLVILIISIDFILYYLVDYIKNQMLFIRKVMMKMRKEKYF